mgnify:CR=1 FL=1
MKNVILYTDGACSGNPGKGGWGAVLIYKDVQKEFSGYDPNTTNNKMELSAVINGLTLLKEPCKVDVYTDSAYVCNAFTENWIDKWKVNGFRTSKNKPILNYELWMELINLCNTHKVTFHKVKGHADNALNNLCDALATGEISAHSEPQN